MKTLGGNISIRNGTLLDYCWEEGVMSLLPICDKVLICDCESTDDTMDRIKRLAAKEPKVMIGIYPWTDPINHSGWWVDFLNFTREHLPTEWHIQLDGDEVLHESAYPRIRQLLEEPGDFSVRCRRLNFWGDTKHLIPDGHCCGHEVIRIAPTKWWLPTDRPEERAAECMSHERPEPIDIFHYGFIRDRDAWFRKSKVMGRIYAGSNDPRMDRAKEWDGPWWAMPGLNDWNQNLKTFSGSHPKVAHEWLIAHGHPL